MSKVSDLSAMARALQKAQKDPKAYTALQDRVADAYLVLLDESAPPDVEGRLRSSLQKKPWKGEQEWVIERSGHELLVGTKVYYAVMINDGHIIGKRRKGHNHRKRKDDARYDEFEYVLGFAPGNFFAEKALQKLDNEIEGEGDRFFADLLEEAFK